MLKPALFVTVLLISFAGSTAPLRASSYYPVRLEDPQAITLVKGSDGLQGDGAADDTAALQRAIDRVQETKTQGIVLLPEGRYRITQTLSIWPGVRVIGFGANRPVLLLAAKTPGYQDKASEKMMIHFTGYRPRPGSNTPPSDANPGTFYSAMSNIDLEIGDGNPGAVGVRGTYAQHCFLAHMEFRIGSGLAGVHDTGNVMEDVHFSGGDYGIWTRTPSPGWQFTAVDASFEGQRLAAIRETQAGLTLVRPHFRNLPTAISIDEGWPDELWIKDARMENLTGPAVIIGLEENPRTEINMENVVCRAVPVFVQYRQSGKKVNGPSALYQVKSFSYGLHYRDLRAQGEVKQTFDAAPLGALPAPVATDLFALPPAGTWVNVRTLGAKGDGQTDDTDVLKKAIAEHQALYFPTGIYVISSTLALRPDTALIALHPSTTQLLLKDRTPAFQGAGNPVPMIEAPQGGTNIVIGLGLYTNGINPRAVAATWMAGTHSMMNDVRFHGGHGTARWQDIYNNTHTADPDLNRRWDSQYPSLWVTNGGGGTFFDLWTPSTFAQAGMLVSDTTAEGRVYEMSSEHHVRNEIILRNVSNWHIYALQTEEERGEGGFALPLEIENSSNITIANFHLYRVISSYQPFPYAVKVTNSSNIRFRNFHCYSNSKVSFDSAIHDATTQAELRQREFASLTLNGPSAPAVAKTADGASAASAKVEKLAGGFFNISGGAAHPNGDYYFVDAYRQRIYRWSVSKRELSIVRDSPLDPVNLAFDKAGNLLVVSYAGNGTVYTFRPDEPGLDLQVIPASPAQPRPSMTAVLPVSDWRFQLDSKTERPLARTDHYLSPDGTTYIAATHDFAVGTMSWGIKSSDLLRSFGLAAVEAGKPFYYTSEAEVTTRRLTVGPDGNIRSAELFANQGGESVAVGPNGNVYIGAGQIFVYSPQGRLLECIPVPERPINIVFGGKDNKTLFITARTSLYSVRIP